VQQQTRDSHSGRNEKKYGKSKVIDDYLTDNGTYRHSSESGYPKDPDSLIKSRLRDDVGDIGKYGSKTDGQGRTVQKPYHEKGEIEVTQFPSKQEICKGQDAHNKTPDGIASFPPYSVNHL
jgi:hypothetical protein